MSLFDGHLHSIAPSFIRPNLGDWVSCLKISQQISDCEIYMQRYGPEQRL
jgi:hypothetical protein